MEWKSLYIRLGSTKHKRWTSAFITVQCPHPVCVHIYFVFVHLMRRPMGQQLHVAADRNTSRNSIVKANHIHTKHRSCNVVNNTQSHTRRCDTKTTTTTTATMRRRRRRRHWTCCAKLAYIFSSVRAPISIKCYSLVVSALFRYTHICIVIHCYFIQCDCSHNSMNAAWF